MVNHLLLDEPVIEAEVELFSRTVAQTTRQKVVISDCWRRWYHIIVTIERAMLVLTEADSLAERKY